MGAEKLFGKAHVAMPKPARGLDPDPTERFGFPVPNTTGPVVPPAAGSVAPLPSEPGPPETSGVEPAPARPEVPVDQAEAIGPFRAGVEEPAQATQPVEAGTSEVGQPAVVPGMQPAAPVLDAVSAVPALSESPHVGLRRVATSLLAVPEAQKKRRKHRYLPWLLAVLAVELVVGGVVIVKSPFTVVHHDTVPPVVGLDTSRQGPPLPAPGSIRSSLPSSSAKGQRRAQSSPSPPLPAHGRKLARSSRS